MARKSRIHFSGAYYHVILRGNAGDPIFFDDRDRYRLYIILQYVVEMFHCRIHAFCLMRNHIHLVMQVGDVPLSRIMQNISLRFTTWISFTQSRTGHLFQRALPNRDVSALGRVAKRAINDDKFRDIYAVLLDRLKFDNTQISETLT